eukprot:6893882-Pyramimonas_sp.AAC.1
MSTKTTKTECSRKNTTASRYFVPNKRKLTRGGPAGVGGPHLLQVDDDPGAALLNVLKGKVKLLRAVALHGSQNLGSEASIMHTDGHLHIVWGHSQHGTVTCVLQKNVSPPPFPPHHRGRWPGARWGSRSPVKTKRAFEGSFRGKRLNQPGNAYMLGFCHASRPSTAHISSRPRRDTHPMPVSADAVGASVSGELCLGDEVGLCALDILDNGCYHLPQLSLGSCRATGENQSLLCTDDAHAIARLGTPRAVVGHDARALAS